eukprot:3939301-Amphidinium_carterae.1
MLHREVLWRAWRVPGWPFFVVLCARPFLALPADWGNDPASTAFPRGQHQVDLLRIASSVLGAWLANSRTTKRDLSNNTCACRTREAEKGTGRYSIAHVVAVID